MGDPWPSLAIERQFRKLVNPQTSPEYPATLAYLEQARPQVAQEARAALDYEIGQMTDALLAATYATALLRKVWGDEAQLPTHRGETLENPEDLLNLIVGQSDIRG